MHETDAAQLFFRSKNKELVVAFEADPEGKKKLPAKTARRLRDALIREPAISSTLTAHLKRVVKDAT